MSPGVWKALGALALWSSLASLGLRLQSVPPLLLVGVSLLLGGLVGARALRAEFFRPRALALGVYGLFAYHVCLFLALRWAPSVEANLVNYAWPLLMVVFAPLFIPGAALTVRHGLAVALGLSGAAVLAFGRAGGRSGHALGYALAFAAAVIWSTYSLTSKRLGIPTAAVSAFCLVSGALAVLTHAVLERAWPWDATQLPWWLLMGLGPMGGAFYLWDAALKEGDPRIIGALAYLTPLVSTLLLVATGGGVLTGRVVLAGALILGGAVLVRPAAPKTGRAEGTG